MRTILLCVLAISLGVAGLTLSTAAADDDAPVFVDAGAQPDAAPVVDAGSAAGSAVTTPALPDPIAQPAESLSLVTKLWKAGAIGSAIIVALFLGLLAASRKIKFLQTGYAAIIVAALLGAGVMLAERASSGTTPTFAMFMSAFITAVALALKPKQPMGPPAEPAK